VLLFPDTLSVIVGKFDQSCQVDFYVLIRLGRVNRQLNRLMSSLIIDVPQMLLYRIPYLLQFPRLQRVTFSGGLEHHYATLPSLRCLSALVCNYSRRSFFSDSVLLQLTQLTSLTFFFDTGPPFQDTTVLALSHLKSLTLAYSNIINPSAIIQLTGLTYLELDIRFPYPKDLVHVTQLTSLTHLVIDDARVRFQDLSPLQALTRLKCAIEASGARTLSRLTKLKELDFGLTSSLHIDDLPALTNLEVLRGHTKDGWDEDRHKHMFPSLQRINYKDIERPKVSSHTGVM
jgi:hypothetical protein